MARNALRALLRPAAGESGGVLVEAALVIPLVLAVAFGVVMAGRIAHAQVGVGAVAREAGRTLAQAPSAHAGLAGARERALAVADGHGLEAAELELVLEAGAFRRGGTVRARASYRVALGDLPLYGLIEVTVRSTHRERVELYRGRATALP
ncbi:MAG: pilus assembly protein [Chloroflexi bacterium]|nr:pilus assembly protein [Chloroflexota bacterium]